MERQDVGVRVILYPVVIGSLSVLIGSCRLTGLLKLLKKLEAFCN